MKQLEEKKKTIQAKLDGKLPLFDENETGKATFGNFSSLLFLMGC